MSFLWPPCFTTLRNVISYFISYFLFNSQVPPGHSQYVLTNQHLQSSGAMLAGNSNGKPRAHITLNPYSTGLVDVSKMMMPDSTSSSTGSSTGGERTKQTSASNSSSSTTSTTLGRSQGATGVGSHLLNLTNTLRRGGQQQSQPQQPPSVINIDPSVMSATSQEGATMRRYSS